MAQGDRQAEQDTAPLIPMRIAAELDGLTRSAQSLPERVSALAALDAVAEMVAEARDELRALVLPELHTAPGHRIDVEGLGSVERTSRRSGVRTNGRAVARAAVISLLAMQDAAPDAALAEASLAHRRHLAAFRRVAEASGGDAEVISAAEELALSAATAAAETVLVASGSDVPSAAWRRGILGVLGVDLSEHQEGGETIYGVRVRAH